MKESCLRKLTLTAWACILSLQTLSSAKAAEFIVPSADYPTLQEAVDAAVDSADQINLIHLSDSPVFTHAEVFIGDEFNEGHRLLIRPNPAMPDLKRATIASRNGSQPIFRLGRSASVRFADLDIVRFSTNNENLMVLDDCADILIERCRVGSIWNSVGSEGWSNLIMSYPENVIVRNCIFFSYLPGNFDTGITASFGDQSNSLLLYNNVVADYSVYGIQIAAHQDDALVLLRNNVVVNHPELVDEPVAYRSVVDDEVTVVTSHNVAFASPGNVETIAPGAQSISGEAALDFLLFDAPLVADTFVEHTWITNPVWDPNANFFRLEPMGPLHDDPADAGVTVLGGAPHPRDIKVLDDIEKDPRPSGEPRHTDRGADQIAHDDLLANLVLITLNPNPVVGGKSTTGKVSLNGAAPSTGALVTLVDNLAATTVPANVTIPSGQSSATFMIKTTAVPKRQKGSVTATYRAISKSRTLTVQPIGIK
jgi:hypothetical protein